ncbi:MAG: methyltransferase domain-containing protein [Acidobacteria bacterium]|nr:methyltransferase domain-containing protein [Acidobacteriota bacterium]
MNKPSGFDSNAFRDFERSGWQQAAYRYPNYFTALTAQVLDPLLDAVGLRSGMRLLDVASGPGNGTAHAAQRGAAAVGADISPTMVARARQSYPELPFVVADAEELPFDAAAFDAVVTNFGLLHLGQPERALREFHRVLRPAGRVGFTVWAPPEDAVGFGILLRSVEAHGNPNVSLPAGPPFFRFSDPEECCQALAEAGFAEPRAVKVSQTWRLPSADILVDAFMEATVRTGGLLRAQSPPALEAIRAAVRDACRAYEKEGALELPMPAMLASGVKT